MHQPDLAHTPCLQQTWPLSPLLPSQLPTLQRTAWLQLFVTFLLSVSPWQGTHGVGVLSFPSLALHSDFSMETGSGRGGD